MFKSCQYCGGIHETTYECPSKPKRKYKQNKYSEVNGEIKRFRGSTTWQNKREDIQQRDLHMCQVCIRLLYDWCTVQYNYENTSVHHIDKLSDAFDKRLNNYNLVTLCPCCHTAADQDKIPMNILLDIARQQEDNGK